MSQEAQALPILRDDERHYDAVKVAINLLVSINETFPLEGDRADKRNRVGAFQRDAIMLFTWRELFAFQVVFSEEYGEHFAPTGYCFSDDALRGTRGFVECFCQDRRIPRTELTALGFWVKTVADSEFPHNIEGVQLWDDVQPKPLSADEKTTLDGLLKDLHSSDRWLRRLLFGAIAKDVFKYKQPTTSRKHVDASIAPDWTTTIANKEPVKQAIKRLNVELKKAAEDYVSRLATEDELTQGFREVVMRIGTTIDPSNERFTYTNEELWLSSLAESLAKATPQAVRKLIKDVDPKRIEKVLVERAAYLFTSATSWEMPSRPVAITGVAQEAFRNLQEAMFAELPRSPLALSHWIEKQKKDRGFKQEENGLIYIKPRKKQASVEPRLWVDDGTKDGILDTVRHHITDPQAFVFFKFLCTDDFKWRSADDIRVATRIIQRLDKVRRKLPAELNCLVHSRDGRIGGYQIILPQEQGASEKA